MNDAWKIIGGLIVFLFLLASPLWYNYTIGKTDYVPVPKKPADQKQCVEPTSYMKAYHMDLLNSWRDSVVRNANRVYIASDGKQYNMSLTNNCLKCHTDKVQFCDQCHNYTAVSPYCWDCHLIPEEKQ